MKNLLEYNEFVSNETMLFNEGLLSNLFGALMKKDMWMQIKGDNGVKSQFKEIDDNLKGFGLTKIKNPNASQNIRQTLVNWASDKYEAKKNAKEGGVKLKDILDSISFKDKKDKTDEEKKEENKANNTLKELKEKVEEIDKKYQKELDNLTQDPELKRWANILKDRMDDVIDKILCKEFDKKGKYTNKLEKAKKKMEEDLKKIDDEAQKEQKKTLEDIKKEREKVLKGCNTTIVSDSESAKNLLDRIKNAAEQNKGDEVFEFNIPDTKKKIVKNIETKDLGKLLGLKMEKGDGFEKRAMFYTIKLLNEVIIENIEKDFKKTIDSISGVSLQAALVSYCQLVYRCLLGDTKINNKDLETCMVRCAVLNNTMVGFGLPAPDEQENAKDEDKRSLFIYYVSKTKEALNAISSKDAYRLKKCATNIDTICGEIANKAKELVNKYNEEQKQKLEKQEKEREKIKNKNE